PARGRSGPTERSTAMRDPIQSIVRADAHSKPLPGPERARDGDYWICGLFAAIHRWKVPFDQLGSITPHWVAMTRRAMLDGSPGSAGSMVRRRAPRSAWWPGCPTATVCEESPQERIVHRPQAAPTWAETFVRR